MSLRYFRHARITIDGTKNISLQELFPSFIKLRIKNVFIIFHVFS